MSDDRRKVLLEVFIKTFCKYGLDGTTTKKLAKEANISEAGLYVYFKNKEDILLQCYHYLIHNAMKEIEGLMKKHSGHPQEIAEALFVSVKSKLLENRFVYQLMLHPNYDYLTKQIREDMMLQYSTYAKPDSEQEQSQEAAQAIFLLFNSALNNYILNQDEEKFRIQTGFLFKLLKQESVTI